MARPLKHLWVVISCLLSVAPATAAELVIDLGTSRTFSTEDLLARADATTITVPMDVSYGRPMTYRAVPLRSLLGTDAQTADDDVQLAASDGFITNLPTTLVFPSGGAGAVPWLAIEPSRQPWPPTPADKVTGPFYLVWLDPAASGILREQWPYAIVSIKLVSGATVQWLQLEVGAEVPDGSPIRKGQALVTTQCMVCHPVAGAGAAAVGPDLERPHSPTEYFQPWALKAYIRNPASLRSWSDMEMPAFPPDVLSDADIDAIIVYLGYLAGRRP